MRRITRRQWLLAVAASTAGCGRKRGLGQAPDSITVLYPADETLLGPYWDGPPQFMMFLPLFKQNMRGEFEGVLAESWESTPDFRTTTIRLRDGIRWHDGVPVTARDVKFSLDIRTHPEVQWFPTGSYTVKVIDDLTYAITHHRHNQNGLISIAGLGDDWTVFYPKHIIEKFDPKGFSSWDFWTHPIGNGPYRYVRHVPRTMMELDANAEFWRGKPKISHVVLKFADSDTGRLPELLSGDVDAAPYAKRTEVLKLARSHQFAVYEQLADFEHGMSVLYWNHRNPLFSDATVRRALTLAIDRRELQQFLGLPASWPVLDALVTKEQVRAGEIAEAIPYNPAEANRLLEGIGWSKRDRSGVRIRNGKSFEFSVIGGNGEDANQTDVAVYIQAQFKRIGVRMNIDSLKGEGIIHRLDAGDYEAALHGFWWREKDGRGGLLGAAGYRAPQFLQLEDQVYAAATPAELGRVYLEMTRLFHQDVPATFLYPSLVAMLAGQRIHGLEDCAYRGDITRCMDELWLQEVA
jgi:peptide/nickel transport system substrate-binding protein